jgi:hypothetical protein
MLHMLKHFQNHHAFLLCSWLAATNNTCNAQHNWWRLVTSEIATAIIKQHLMYLAPQLHNAVAETRAEQRFVFHRLTDMQAVTIKHV